MKSTISDLIYLIKDNIKSLSTVVVDKIRIGFLVPQTRSYTKVMASTRLRAYDIIKYLNRTDTFYAELYKPWRKYDLCVFQKYFDANAYEKLTKLKKQGTKTLLDINVNFFEKSDTNKFPEKRTKEIRRFGKEVDGFITASSFLNKIVKRFFPKKKTIVIPENIDKKIFTIRKIHKSKKVLRLLYIGYAIKAKEILIIKDVLEKLGLDYNLEILFVCEKHPKIEFNNLKTRFVKFNLDILSRLLVYGDIKVAPRDLKERYNLAHTFTKIGYPMAVGLPVVASPIDSYLNSPAILCKTDEEWESNLRSLIIDTNLRNKLAEEGIKYCKENFSLDLIGKRYEQLFRNLINAGI